MKKVEKNRIIQIKWIYFDVKPMLNVSVLNNLYQNFDIMRFFHTVMDGLTKIKGAKKMYITKDS